MFLKKEHKLNRQQKRQRLRKINKTISKIRVAQWALESGCTTIQARLHLRALYGWHKDLESLGVVKKQNIFQKMKSIWRGIKLWR